MLFKLALLAVVAASCDAALYSSFWAPLFNPRILNFRVDATFDPEAGTKAREQYVNKYGARGEKLIDDLGNGKGPGEEPSKKQSIQDVRFYYTYPGANQNEPYTYK